ncbi:MAG: UDP-N-acetylmuramate dehydrogenase [Thermoguttaceae bacterium]|nr:UDP-N-acetylmuramate dehydrogenase [Thermoguttaceae bacterium]
MEPFSGMESIVRHNEPLAMYTWFQIGGNAEFFAEPTTVEELTRLQERCREQNLPIRVLGRGSNILVRDEGVHGLVVHLASPVFQNLTVQGNTVEAGCGVGLNQVIMAAVHHGLAGLEELVAIPGSIGGAVRGNVCSHGGDLSQWITSVTVASRDGSIEERSRDEMAFSHRRCEIDSQELILSAKFELEEDDPVALSRRLQKEWILRRSMQPLAHQCAGRIFRDPREDTAATLIALAGLKGTRIGGAMISERHAGFIVTEAEATFSDVARLIELVQNQVRTRMGVELELEIEIW